MDVRVPSRGDVVLTPRVLDQASFDELAGSLEALIEQARAAGGELRGVLGEVADARAETAGSAGFLQERLRVSVRMLKAFQTQIEHIESLLETLQQRERDAQRTLAGIDERIECARQRAEALEDLVESAEVNIAVAAHKAAQVVKRSEETRETP